MTTRECGYGLLVMLLQVALTVSCIFPPAGGIPSIVHAETVGASWGDSVTLESIVTLADDPGLLQGDGFWLALLLPGDDLPEGVGLLWRSVGFFPVWRLVLQSGVRPSTIDALPRAGQAGYTELTTATPSPGHTYSIAMSLNRSTGDVDIRVRDLTGDGTDYAARVRVTPPSPSALHSVHPHAMPNCSDANLGTSPVCLDALSTSTHYVPYGTSWRLVHRTGDSYVPHFSTHIHKDDPTIAVELGAPEHVLPGSLSVIAMATDERPNVAVRSVTPGRSVVALDTATLPLGEITLSLQYAVGEDAWVLDSRELRVLRGSVTVGVRPVHPNSTESQDRAAGAWVGELTFESPERLTGVDIIGSVTLEAAMSDGWEEVHRSEFAQNGLDLDVGMVSLPLHVPLAFSEPTVVRVVLKVEQHSPDIHVTPSPREIRFIASADTEATMHMRAHFEFDGFMSDQVLNNYLSRAISMLGVAHPDNGEVLEDIRFILNTGAKFIGRAAYAWTAPDDDEAHFAAAERVAALLHQADPDIILQAAIFEAVYEGVSRIRIPPWVFKEFGLPVEERNFRYEEMLYPDGTFVGHWSTSPGGSVPDMSRLETRMWFFYRAKRYIDAGFEAIHFGQVHLMAQNDPDYRYWQEILGRVREYARQHARNHFILADAHTHGVVVDGNLLFDFHSYPLRIVTVRDRPHEGELRMWFLDSIYGRSAGGITPSGWRTDALPFLVEIDNFGSSGKAGEPIGGIWVWGYDEISWFAHQDEAYRNEWLRYAWQWVRQHSPNGWLQMPAKRVIAEPVNGVGTYRANTQSFLSPHGFNQEQTIKQIWDEHRR